MAWSRWRIAATLGLVLVGVGMLVWGYEASRIRDTFVFAPRAEAAVAAIEELAARQKAVLAKSGNYVEFTPSTADAQFGKLGVSGTALPLTDFQFDAKVLPDGRLRLRALPRTEGVTDLRVAARMYVSELSPAGDVVNAGWFP